MFSFFTARGIMNNLFSKMGEICRKLYGEINDFCGWDETRNVEDRQGFPICYNKSNKQSIISNSQFHLCHFNSPRMLPLNHFTSSTSSVSRPHLGPKVKCSLKPQNSGQQGEGLNYLPTPLCPMKLYPNVLQCFGQKILRCKDK